MCQLTIPKINIQHDSQLEPVLIVGAESGGPSKSVIMTDHSGPRTIVLLKRPSCGSWLKRLILELRTLLQCVHWMDDAGVGWRCCRLETLPFFCQSKILLQSAASEIFS